MLSYASLFILQKKLLFFNCLLFQPVFQISVENIVNESELQQSTQNFETEPNSIDQIKLPSCRELTCKETVTQEYQSLSSNDSIASENDGKICKQKPINTSVKKNSPGRPKKNKAISLQVIQVILKFVYILFSHMRLQINYMCN